jgi:hypothetical protein
MVKKTFKKTPENEDFYSGKFLDWHGLSWHTGRAGSSAFTHQPNTEP